MEHCHEERSSASLREALPCVLLPLMVLAVHVGMLAYSAHCHSPVVDEIVRVRAGCNHWWNQEFSDNPGNPPLNDLVAAVPVALLSSSDDLYNVSQLDALLNTSVVVSLVIMARLSAIAFALLAACVCYMWARQLLGQTPAIVVLMLWCFDPMVISHGSLVTGDMAAASTGIAAWYTFWRWMRRATVGRACIAGVCIGFALIAKFVSIVFVPLWCAVFAVHWLRSPCHRGSLALHSVIMFAMATLVVNAGYMFQQSFEPLSAYVFRSEILANLASPCGDCTGVGWVGRVIVPLPKEYLLGIDAVVHHTKAVTAATYVHGVFSAENVWYFYLYGLLFKMPLGTVIILCIAVYARVVEPGNVSLRSSDLALWVPSVSVLVFVSTVTVVKLLRYVLPALPFMLIWAGHSVAWGRHTSMWRKVVAWCAIAWSVLGSLAVFPHSLSYFNELAGGTRNGHAHLIWASFDWGQDLLFLKDWADKHTDAQPLFVACYGAVNPGMAGIQCVEVPQGVPLPGWYAVSASVLRGAWQQQGSLSEDARWRGYRYLTMLLSEEPVGSAGYSILIFHLSSRRASEMRVELELQHIEGTAALASP